MTHLPFLAGIPRATARRSLALSSAALVATLALTSCAPEPNGIQKEKGPAIAAAAARALGSARTFEIQASSTVQGSQGSITFDIEGQNEGVGTFTSSTISFQAEELRGTDYFRSTTLWSQVGGAGLQTDLGNRWVYIAASSSTAADLTQAFATLTSPKALEMEIAKQAPTAVRGKASVYEGQSVIAVSEPPTRTLYVATTGNPYPLRWVQPGSGSVIFRDFGKRFHLKAPRKPLNLAAILAG
ncbi:MAG TPA: hypothetical protein VMW80_12765 [Candidatus Dormibacteraeota bacterium]|nr:hypothetical protein [Candidatus Dormibacteraeota bacterium]